MKVILGLGNPGSRYDNTWHNMGFEVIDELTRRFGVSKYKKECEALTAHIMTETGKVILAKPQTFMNLSGDCVYLLAKKYKIDLSDFLVIADDIDITRGEVRFRERGSGGTHNGLRNIIAVMGSQEFPRIKVGIGRGNPIVPLADYVLRRLSAEEQALMSPAIITAADMAIEKVIE
ncbi:MAG: aminoacyl-tRNA hydrolase [Firmicutes bacterium]|nr:aminoacyl-tRNA hydrolase [Bacillota bacterium]